MNNKTKAREFFVFPEQHLCLEPGGQAALGMTGEQQFIPHIRVIEHSAYADLEAKLQIAVKAMEKYGLFKGESICGCNDCYMCDMADALKKIRGEL